MAQKTQPSTTILILVVGGVCAGAGYYVWNSRKPSLMEEMQQPLLPEDQIDVVEEVIIIPEEGASQTQEVVEISSPDQLDALVTGNKKAVIKFYANWCGACNHLASYFGDVAAEIGNGVSFYSINVDNKELMTKVQTLEIPKEPIMYLPTIVFLQPGKTHEQMTGAPSKDALLEKVRSVFGS